MAQAEASPKVTTLESLPEDLLREICRYLDGPNLNNFSLVNKFCKSISTSCRRWEITLEVSTPTQLQEDVKIWMSRLDGFNRAGVKKLKIKGCMSLDDTDTQQTSPTNDVDVISSMSSEARAWAPLTTFLRDLPALAILVYECSPQFPRSLFASLQKYLPHCQLFLKLFYLANPNSEVLEPYEEELLTSTQLHGIEAPWADCHHEPKSAYNGAVALALPLVNKYLRQISVDYNIRPYCCQCKKQLVPAYLNLKRSDSVNTSSQHTYDSITCLQLTGHIDCQITLQQDVIFPKLKKLELSALPFWTLCQHEASWNLGALEELTISLDSSTMHEQSTH